MADETGNNPPTPQRLVRDPQTGEYFELHKEKWYDVAAALISILYLLPSLVFCAWLPIDKWSRQFQFAGHYSARASLGTPIFRLMAYAAIGGALGGTVDGMRSFFKWHADRQSLSWRFIWKYLAAPLLGATLAIIVYALIRGGIAAFSGGLGSTEDTAVASLFALGTGALAGYGSRKVFVWLDEQVNRLFRTAPVTSVPELKGLTADEARKKLEQAKLKVGDTKQQPSTDTALVGKVISQSSEAETTVDEGTAVDIVIRTA